MDSKLKIALAVLLVALTHGSFAQISERFIVSVTSYTTNLGASIYRCRGTVITDRHVLTTASCLTQIPSGQNVALRVELVWDTGSASSTVPAERYFIHPNYTAGRDEYSNVAVVLLDGQFNVTSIPPRSLGQLQAINSTATLFGWGAAPDVPRREIVSVVRSAYCNPNQPEVFCSIMTNTISPCTAQFGSPVVLTTGAIDGFVLNHNESCHVSVNGDLIVAYHSVGQYRDWILQVSGAETSAKLSIIAVSSALLIAFRRFVF